MRLRSAGALSKLAIRGNFVCNPTVLIRELYALGILNSKQLRTLESARQQRTAIAHGLMSRPVSPDIVLQIIQLTEQLLSS